MPSAREPLLDAEAVAAQGAVIEREFALSGFTRLRDRLAAPDGSVRARLSLRLVDGVAAGEIELTAAVMLECQRCLQPMARELRSESELAFVAGDAERVPAEYEVIAGDPKRVDLAALVEDELLLALPVIARHAPGEDCRWPDAGAAAEQAAEPAMRRPFAGLKDLLNH